MKNLLFTSLFLLCACASRPTSINTLKAAKIRTVAIIGFEINQRQPMENFGISTLSSMDRREGLSGTREMRMMAASSYESFRQSLMRATGWQVLGLEAMRKVKLYNNTIIQEMTGMVTGWGPDNGYEQFVAPGTLDHKGVVQRLGQEKRDELARALNVDAVITVIQFQDIDQSLLAIGRATDDSAYSYKTKSTLLAYVPGKETPVWQVTDVPGKAVNSAKYRNREKLLRISLAGSESSASSANALVRTLKR